MRVAPVLAIDFDGTIVDADGNVLPGARDAINLLREQGHKIIIHSCNRADYIKQVLNNADIRFDSIWTKEGKPVASLYIDDRGYKFVTWEGVIADVIPTNM